MTERMDGHLYEIQSQMPVESRIRPDGDFDQNNSSNTHTDCQ
ncbi:hypothetical protein HSR121_1697 [Halapricum desulfuricans]|uniref:Uncharacterized protein n=1 Tax=Halapricum desulfuricans TaxID=2841257 RepID=A0A897N014_9EURY|nr:hypothetical protein HSR121_1697 [Halapricum desulfuricans]